MTDSRTPDRDVDRVIRSWLHEDRHEDVSRVAGAVLDQVEATPQHRSTWWPVRRTPVMNKFATIALGAAAVVVALVVGVQLFSSPGGGTGGQSSPSPSAQVTPEPTQSPAAATGLPEGPHLILTGEADDPTDNIRPLTVTIPSPGWEGDVGGGILFKDVDGPPTEGAGMIIFVGREFIVYGDACRWEGTQTLVTTVDEFVAALSAQGSRDASEPVDVTVDGYAGKSITLSVPDEVDFADCDPGYGGSWDCDGDGMGPCGYHGGPEAIDTVYVVDVEGQIMAWVTNYFTGTSPEDVAELAGIVQSASFGE